MGPYISIWLELCGDEVLTRDELVSLSVLTLTTGVKIRTDRKNKVSLGGKL